VSTILVVDDEPAIRALVTDLLRYEGHTVLSAANGQEALDVASVEHPDLIVMDIMMPVMDGQEALRRLHERGHLNGTLVILASATVRLERPDFPIQAFLRKPFDLDQLMETVSRVLDEAS
jgi:CheY-like chemotaxis protein